MTDAVKPATDKTPNKATETDASKKEKEAASGALDKMKSEVADATKPKHDDPAKKTEDAAKKPEDAAKKPEDVAKKPEVAAKKPDAEKSWAELALDEVRNSSIASWMGIKAPDKSPIIPKVEEVAKPKLEAASFLDFNSPIAGYDAKKTEAALDLKKPDAAPVVEPAKDGGGLWGWIENKASDAGKWVKDNFWAEKAEKADKVLDSFSEVKIDDTKYQYKAIAKDDGLYDILTKKNDGDVCKIGETGCTRTYGDIQTTWDRQTKSSHMFDKESKTSYDRLSDGTQVVSQADGVKYVKRPDGSYEKIVGDQITTISGEADKRVISQKLGELELIYHQGKRLDLGRLGRPGDMPCKDHNTVEAGENYKYTVSPDGKTKYGYVDGKQFAVVADNSAYIFDPRTKQSIHVDQNGKEIERGTAEEFAKRVPGLIVTPDGKIRMAGAAQFSTDAVSGLTTTEMTNKAGQKIVNVSAGPDGVENTKFVAADGKVMSQSDINHKDPTHLLVDKDASGKPLDTYNSVDNSYSASDGSFKFSDTGTELFGGQVYVDRASGDISYADGVRLSNTSAGAIQASEAQAISASANASSVASALSAKAGNPATVSAGDLSACYGAYGSIVAAMNACLTSGNFAGFAQCMSAKGALESAIGVIAPKLVAMDDASRSGLSGYALNEVGQKTGGSTDYRAIDEVINRQNGTSRSAT